MKFNALILSICFCSLVYAIACVNIAKLKQMNKYQNFSGIGLQCNDTEPSDTKCILDNGKDGVCAELCIIPDTKDAKICCHVRDPFILYIFFCCEKGTYVGRGDSVGGLFTKPNEFPYMAALGWFKRAQWTDYDYKCGAVLITRKFLLTAAHCSYIDGVEPIVALLGGHNLTKFSGFNVPLVIEAVHVHPDYDDEFVYNDIALVELVGLQGGAIIDIWRRSDIVNTSFTAMGYGDTTFGGTSSDVLIKVFLQHFSINDCQRFYSEEDNVPDGITNTQLCAKDPENKMDTCQGDSGGPLIMTSYNKNTNEKREYLVGITSFGLGCASLAPGVYTKVSAYTQWINETIEQRLTKSKKKSDDKEYYV